MAVSIIFRSGTQVMADMYDIHIINNQSSHQQSYHYPLFAYVLLYLHIITLYNYTLQVSTVGTTKLTIVRSVPRGMVKAGAMETASGPGNTAACHPVTWGRGTMDAMRRSFLGDLGKMETLISNLSSVNIHSISNWSIMV